MAKSSQQRNEEVGNRIRCPTLSPLRTSPSYAGSPVIHSDDNELAQGHGEEKNGFQLEKVGKKDCLLIVL